MNESPAAKPPSLCPGHVALTKNRTTSTEGVLCIRISNELISQTSGPEMLDPERPKPHLKHGTPDPHSHLASTKN
jgi:hypothetical protein